MNIIRDSQAKIAFIRVSGNSSKVKDDGKASNAESPF